MNTGKNAKLLRIPACLTAVIAVVFMLASCGGDAEDKISRVLDFGTAMKGVHVAGIDLSGMTKKEALAATASVPADILGKISFSVDINGETAAFSPAELGVDTDYENVIETAMMFGHTGTHEERVQSASAAGSGLVNFDVSVRAEELKVRNACIPLKAALDRQPVNAGFSFMPNGYASDGTAYDPNSGAKPVRISDDRKPNPLRYQYYLTDEYVKNYIPKNASISHFQYTPEQNGRSVDAEALAVSVINSVNNKDYSVISVPVEVLEPAIKTEDVMRFTQLVSSWTSSYESHNNADRNFNVAKISGLVNGVVINPGETWSINAQAGPRTYEKGWKGAAGIYDGAYVTEPGGGVCQVSSTVYNAAIRAGLDIVESSRHSIISNYMPIGLDATISTGNKDLKLRNPYDMPVFLVSYVNAKDKNVTVEIYGPPVMHETYGEVILDFSSEVTAQTELPETIVHYKAVQTPDGKPVAPGTSRLYIHPRKGTTAQVYIHYLSPDGTELGSKKLYTAKYPKIKGEKYVNDIPQPDTTDVPTLTPSVPDDTPIEPDVTPPESDE